MFSQYHKKNGQAFESVSNVRSNLPLPLAKISQTEWVVETDRICKQMLNSAGVPLIGYDPIQPAPVE